MQNEIQLFGERKRRKQTSLSYYNITAMFIDLVGLCWFKKNVFKYLVNALFLISFLK